MDNIVLTEEQKNLIVDNIAFAKWWFNKHDIRSEDTQQACWLELCYRIPLYDASRGSITTFISTVFKSALSHKRSYESAGMRFLDQFKLSLDCPLNSKKETEDVFLCDAIPAPDRDGTTIRRLEAQMVMAELIDGVKNDKFNLSQQEKDMFLHYMTSLNYSETGKAFGISRYGSSKIIKRVCNKILERRPNYLCE